MPHSPLSPQEERNYQAALNAAQQEAEIRSRIHITDGTEMPEALADQFVQNIMDFERMQNAGGPPVTIGSLLPDYEFLDPNRLTDERAQSAIDALFGEMYKAGVHINQPRMMIPKDFYRWCRDVLMPYQLDMAPAGGWNIGLIFSELEPLSEDAINSILEQVLDDLLEPNRDMPIYFTEDLLHQDWKTKEITGTAAAYVSAWREAFVAVEYYGYYPQYAEYLSEDRKKARFHFQMDATLVREDGSRDNISCDGTAIMTAVDPYWEIEGLHFKGFSVGER
ncbi:MAG: hypothetical protein AAF597_10050 [Bacteroidota bacterium]